jgi:8-oxo-dGTP pyrophosphatase MutT (NUDIX family)
MQVLTFLKLVNHLQAQHSSIVRTSGRRASVAAIFRLMPRQQGEHERLVCPSYSALLPWQDLNASITSARWAKDADVQLLFVKRSLRVTDRHSGQIAFPGGKGDDNETPFETAVRETK